MLYFEEETIELNSKITVVNNKMKIRENLSNLSYLYVIIIINKSYTLDTLFET